ncbi:hypothetical protein Pr1d_46610 [Bythopirellula goksoeyrii]|uniref:Uncharacterized protein n=1 Tax=Bythopirellula goksoeyrii TaxID=1400387 RepID=A0A5B9QIA9_9BACT|nr:hypothetical protein Pr1d_46610 [Bythopirellula goksoeyrii]
MGTHQRSQSVTGLLALGLHADCVGRYRRASSDQISGIVFQKLHKTQKEAFSQVATPQRFVEIRGWRNELILFWIFDFQETEQDNTTPTVRRNEKDSSNFECPMTNRSEVTTGL